MSRCAGSRRSSRSHHAAICSAATHTAQSSRCARCDTGARRRELQRSSGGQQNVQRLVVGVRKRPAGIEALEPRRDDRCALRVRNGLPDLVAQAVARLPRTLGRHAAQLAPEDAVDDVGAGEFGFLVGADQRARAQLRQRDRQVVDVRDLVGRDTTRRRARRAPDRSSPPDHPAVAAPTRTCLRRMSRRSARSPSS